MSLRFIDGFDWTTDSNDRRRKYDGESATDHISNTGRYGGYSCSVNTTSSLYLRLDSRDTWIIGLALNRPQAADGVILELQDGTTSQITFQRFSDTIRVFRGTTAGTLLGSTGVVFVNDTWIYVEMKVVIHNTTGTIDIHVDEVSELSLSSQDTQATANATADRFVFGNCGTNTKRDDLYICDTAGSTNNDFLGNMRIETLFPNDNGTTNNFVGSDADSVDNYLLADEDNPDDDTTYVESATLNNVDLYNFNDLSNNPSTIFGIATNMHAKKTDVNTRSLTEKVRSGGTNYAAASDFSLWSNYRISQYIRETDPATAGVWTINGINLIEAGFEITT